MTEDNFGNLLKEADRVAVKPAGTAVDISAVRRRANRRRLARSVGAIAAAAAVLMGLGLASLKLKTSEPTREQVKIASLEFQVKQLQASTDATLALIHEVLEDERRKDRLEELQAELASIPDPREEIEKQVDKTAFILVYQADRLYRELNETESAVETYERVIRLFPKNQWAAVARQRLAQIEGKNI